MMISLHDERIRELEMVLHTKNLEAVTVLDIVKDPGKYLRIWEHLRFIFTGERVFQTDADRRLDEYLESYMK